MPLMSLACDYASKYWCDSFNGHIGCYSHVLCSSYSSSMPIRPSLLSNYESSLKLLLAGTKCDYLTFTSCQDSDWDDYSECVYQCGCEQLLSPQFLSKLPQELWVAIKPHGLEYESVDDEEFENYRKFQSCLLRCEDVCEASLEEKDRECIENCILTFCV